MGSQHHHLLFYAEARGLSGERVLTRVIDLYSALQGYCNNIFTLPNKTDAFKKSCWFGIVMYRKAISICFHVCKTLWQVPLLINKELIAIINQHLKKLAVSIGHHFPKKC